VASFISSKTPNKATEKHMKGAIVRYNQAETALTVALETQINQLQACNNGAISNS